MIRHRGCLTKSSIYRQDIAKQRRSEVEMMTGLVCREAAALGISTPICQAITDTISAIDRGERMPGVDNLAATLEAVRRPFTGLLLSRTIDL